MEEMPFENLSSERSEKNKKMKDFDEGSLPILTIPTLWLTFSLNCWLFRMKEEGWLVWLDACPCEEGPFMLSLGFPTFRGF